MDLFPHTCQSSVSYAPHPYQLEFSWPLSALFLALVSPRLPPPPFLIQRGVGPHGDGSQLGQLSGCQFRDPIPCFLCGLIGLRSCAYHTVL